MAAAEAPAGEPAASSAPAKFSVLEYRVLGNSVLAVRDIETAVYPFLGPARTFNDVEAARVALETMYHNRGFGSVFVDIPEQSVNDGIVRLTVGEGRLSKVTVTGARFFSERAVKAAIPAAQRGSVPNLPALQSQLGAANAVTPDRTIVPVLKAGQERNTVDLALQVQDRSPFHGSVELNNQSTADTTPLRMVGLVSYDNAFGRGDSVSLQYQTAPAETSQVAVFAAGYVARLANSNDKLVFTFIKTSSSVATVGALAVLGSGKIYGAHFSAPILTSGAASHSITVGADYKDFGEDVLVDPTSALSSPIKYVNLSAMYAGNLIDEHRRWTWDASVNTGLRGVGSSSQEFAEKCFDCRPNYFYIRGDGSFERKWAHGLYALVRIAGQYAIEPVVSNEQFLLGGADTVRGYLEAEELGDRGARGTLQVGMHDPFIGTTRIGLSPALFLDYGRIDFVRPLPGQPSSVVLGSWGAGLDFSLFDAVIGSVYWADPLRDGAYTQKGDSRVIFSVRSTW
jgi:hemolysin activation/secretion protein